MPLIKEFRYFSPVDEIRTRGDLSKLLADVKDSISTVNPSFANNEVRDVLCYIEKGEYGFDDEESELTTIVNLSDAKDKLYPYLSRLSIDIYEYTELF